MKGLKNTMVTVTAFFCVAFLYMLARPLINFLQGNGQRTFINSAFWEFIVGGLVAYLAFVIIAFLGDAGKKSENYIVLMAGVGFVILTYAFIAVPMDLLTYFGQFEKDDSPIYLLGFADRILGGGLGFFLIGLWLRDSTHQKEN